MPARTFTILAIALLVGAEGSKLTSDLAALNADSSSNLERPIMRVVNLLKDMQGELQKEQDSDEELYDKIVCWCETNDKDKTKAIEDGKQSIEDLSAKVEENTALAATREVELKSLAKQVAELEQALADAAALRQKELKEFNEEEKDLIQSISSLKGAVMTLSKQNPGALLQKEQRSTLLQVAQVLQRRPKLVEQSVAPHQRKQLASLLQGQMNAKGKAPEYAPASGQIFGILKQMKETFETNLENGKKEEAQGKDDYAALKSTKEAELSAANDKIFQKTEELAKAKETVARSSTDREETTATLDADTKFLAELKVKCAELDNEWEKRQKVRAEEIAAVGETLAILTDDDARDTMSAAGTFIQAHMVAKNRRSAQAKTADFLASEAEKLKSSRLSYLATRLRIDPFAKVKESVDGMVVSLGHEQEDEVAKKDGCVTDFNDNEKQTTKQTGHKEDVEVEIESLETEIKAMREEEDAIKAEIAENQAELKKASENREEENKLFQTTIADQRATQEILNKAKDRMAAFYEKKGASAALLQQKAKALRQLPMPGGFGEYKKSGGGGVIALLENLIDEAKETEADAIKGETDAQAAYEEFVKNTNAAMETMSAQIVSDEEVVAQDTQKEVADEADKRATIGDLLSLSKVEGTLHEACDFTVNNFGVRQESRAQEVEALKQANAIFSGMKL